MGTLNAALGWAARGFPVFPLRENTREPAFDADWSAIATTDAETIRRLWQDPVLKEDRNYNVGCLCTDMVVIDIDVKKGKDGYNEYLQMGGNFDTLVVRTPSGGYHCYFYGPDSSNAPLSNGVDVRSHRGYVVAPGSVIDGHAYVVEREQDMAWVPLMIEKRLRPPYRRSELSAAAETDTPAAIEAGIRFLESAPPAVEGQRGDEHTFITAARLVREMALTVDTAYALMLQYWNPRCEPPWDPDQLYQKVVNAHAYGSADEGRLTPQSLFGHLPEIVAPPSLGELMGNFGNALIPTAIQPRPWIMDRMFMLRHVTTLLASGSAGKSTLSIIIAAHLALGHDFARYKTNGKRKTIIYNGEDDLEEQSRRLLAICNSYGFDYDTVRSNILFISARDLKLTLVLREQGRVMRNDMAVFQLIEKASDPEVGLVILDPLVKLHQCDENDNVGMDVVMDTLTDIACQANVAIAVMHHTTKAGDQRQEQRIGNPDIARGASAVINASRVAFTLVNASRQDTEDYGIPYDERHMYVRLDDAKMNMSLATENATWFRRAGVKIFPSNDVVGVLQFEDLKKSKTHVTVLVGKTIISTLIANGKGSMSLNDAVSVVKNSDPRWANLKDHEARRRIEGMFSVAVQIDGHTLQVLRESEDSNKSLITLR